MKLLDVIIISLLTFLFIGLLSFEYTLFGLDKPFLYLPEELKTFIGILPWIIFALFLLDLYLKYRVSNNIQHFLKIHWLDVLLTALFPVFGIFKFIKFGVKIYKIIKVAKISKTGVKIFLGVKKIFKKINLHLLFLSLSLPILNPAVVLS